MKHGTMYGIRLKTAYHRLRASVAAPRIPEPDDPLRRLAVAILGVSSNDEEAARALDQAFSTLVDWNEMRVSSAFELHKAMGNSLPQGLPRCQQLIFVLQSIYEREHRVSLDRLKTLGRREVRQYLEELRGMDEYAAAAVILWSLGGHAVPVNDRLWAALREVELVHPEATREEVQAFLERHVSATQAKEFCLVMRSFTPSKYRDRQRLKSKTKAKKRTTSR